MSQPRDPLSVRYDTATRRLLLRAIADRNAGGGKGSTMFVVSPGREFRSVDKGGRTHHERAFTQSAYYRVRVVPIREGQPVYWSLRLRWGPIINRRGRYGRIATARIFTKAEGDRYARRLPGRAQWAGGPARRKLDGAA